LVGDRFTSLEWEVASEDRFSYTGEAWVGTFVDPACVNHHQGPRVALRPRLSGRFYGQCPASHDNL